MTFLEEIKNALKPTQECMKLVESYVQLVDKKYDSTELRSMLLKAAGKALSSGQYEAVEEDVKTFLSSHKWLRTPLQEHCLLVNQLDQNSKGHSIV